MNKRWLITGTGFGPDRALADASLEQGVQVAAFPATSHYKKI
jgi:hypothetical protein